MGWICRRKPVCIQGHNCHTGVILQGSLVQNPSPMTWGVSASYLSRKFKEVTGQTFPTFSNGGEQAIVMLGTMTSIKRISEISEATGFTD